MNNGHETSRNVIADYSRLYPDFVSELITNWNNFDILNNVLCFKTQCIRYVSFYFSHAYSLLYTLLLRYKNSIHARRIGLSASLYVYISFTLLACNVENTVK